MGDQSTLRQRHVDPSTPAAPAPSTKPTISSALLSWDAIDHWRRDNHYITSGYRIDKASYHHTFLSLTHLHNESVNIWSHLLGAVIAVLSSTYLYTQIKPRYDSASQQDVIVFGCFFTGAFLCLGMSATFHALLSHSQDHAKWGNKLDYTGIVLLIVGSYVPALYYGFFCEPLLMRFYLGLIFTLGTGCALVSWVDRFRTSAWRPYRAAMFIALGLSGIIPVAHGVTIFGYSGLEARMSISLVILHGAMYIFGAVLYASRFPERMGPAGRFDIWGSSHQIFHLCVLLAAGTHLYAMGNAFDYHHTGLGSTCVLN